jgi:hypothetical protein
MNSKNIKEQSHICEVKENPKYKWVMIEDGADEEENLMKRLIEIRKKKALQEATEKIREFRKNEIEIIRNEISEKKERFCLEIQSLNRVINEIQEGKKDNDILEKILSKQNINIISNNTDENNTTTIPNNADEINTTNIPNNSDEKRHREIIRRLPLYDVITQRTFFKTTIRNAEFNCYTENGRQIISDGKTFRTLNEWLDFTITSMCGSNTTKKSVYEVIYYYNNAKKEWRPLKTDYTGETTLLN